MRRAPLLLAAAVFATPAEAATLRTLTTLNAPVVLLSDLFDDAGDLAGRVLGPAPPPGERIVVEAAQLAAIARQFGVDWRPASPADRAVLERPGRMLPREAIIAPLLAAIARVGGPAEATVDLPGFEAPLVPTEARPEVTVEQLNYEGSNGRFDAIVLVAGQAMLPLRLRLTGQAEEALHVLVPARRLAAGKVLAAGDLLAATLPASAVHGEPLRDMAQAMGLALRRSAMPGQPLVQADVQRAFAVAKGARVAMELHMPGLAVAALGVALEAGTLGERIRVLNPASRMEVAGEVIGPDRVRVAPDSVPAPTGDGNQVAER